MNSIPQFTVEKLQSGRWIVRGDDCDDEPLVLTKREALRRASLIERIRAEERVYSANARAARMADVETYLAIREARRAADRMQMSWDF